MRNNYLILSILLTVFIALSVKQYQNLIEKQKLETSQFIKKEIVLCGEGIERSINDFEESVKYEFANRELEYFFDPEIQKLDIMVYNKYIFNDIKKIRQFYSSYQVLISKITIYNQKEFRTFHRNNQNYFNITPTEQFKEEVKLYTQPSFIDENENFYFIQPITNAKGELIANAKFSLNIKEFLEDNFSRYYIAKNFWSWVIYNDKMFFHKYSEPSRDLKFETDIIPFFKDKLNSNLSAATQHIIVSDKKINAYSAFYPVNIFNKNFGIVFSVNTDTLYEEQNEVNRLFFIYVLLAIISIIYLFTTIIKQIRIAQRKLESNQNELIKARDEAQKANNSKSEFLSRMSHELRTPLNAILGFSQLLKMGELNPGQSKGVNHILNSGKHLLSLINEVLDISRIESGNPSVSIETVCVNNVIIETIDLSKPIATNKNIQLEFSQNEIFYVYADPQRLKQILINLINNAIKYNVPNGKVNVEISSFRNLDNKENIRIKVIDTGIGIKNEDIHKLFTPFERIGADRTTVEGTGLGLSLVKKLAEIMAGEIGLESKAGIGSIFWIDLPSAIQNNDTKEPIRENNFSKNSSENHKGTILYIEDNSSNIELVEEILSTHRPQIKLITHMYGAQTVDLAIENKPDIVLLDLNLPDVYGESVLNELKSTELTKDIPVIIISADAITHQIDKLKKAGAYEYLTKPIDLDIFIQYVDHFIE